MYPERRIYRPDEESPRRPMLDWLQPPPIQINAGDGGNDNWSGIANTLGRAVAGQLKRVPNAPDIQMPDVSRVTVPEPALPAPNIPYDQPRDMTQIQRPRRVFPRPY